MEIRDGRRWLSALLSSAVNFAVIALMLGGWLFSLQTICDVTTNGGILFICSVLLALVSATLFALPAMPRRIGIGFLILGAALTLWRWEPLLPGLQELLSRVSTPLSTLFPALALPQTDASASELFPCILFLAALMALMLGFFTWARCWWAAMTVCFLPFLPSVLAGTMPSWPGFLAMLAGCLTLLFTALYPPEDLRSLGWGRLTSLAMSALLLLLLAVALPQESYEYPQWAKNARNMLMNAANDGLDNIMDWEIPTDLPFGSGDSGAAASSAEEVDLTAVGPRSFTGRTMLQVEGTEAGRVYLRGSSSSVYTGTSWEPLPEDAYLKLTETDIAIDPAQGLLYPQLYCMSEMASLTIRHAAASDTLAYFPYQPTRDTVMEILTPVRDAYLTRQTGQSSYTLPYLPDIVPRESVQQDASEEYTYRPFVYHYYLDVPEETARLLAPLSSRLPEMDVQAPEDLSENYRYAVTTALQTARLLGELAVYDLNTPAMAEGEDFVAHFLEEGRGYCVHFATTAVLLLRMNGIPARYVSGYTADITPGEVVDVPDYAAHAWVEIYLDGYGWYPVEVTPGGGETGAELPGTEESLPPDETDPNDQTQNDTPAVPTQPWESDPSSDKDTDNPTENSDSDGTVPEEKEPLNLRWLLIPGSILLLAGLAWGLERLARSYRRKEETKPDTNASALAAYRRYRRLLTLGAAEDLVLEELGRKAKFSQHTLTEEERHLCWQRLSDAGLESSELPRWKRLVLKVLVRY